MTRDPELVLDSSGRGQGTSCRRLGRWQRAGQRLEAMEKGRGTTSFAFASHPGCYGLATTLPRAGCRVVRWSMPIRYRPRGRNSTGTSYHYCLASSSPRSTLQAPCITGARVERRKREMGKGEGRGIFAISEEKKLTRLMFRFGWQGDDDSKL